MMKLLTVVTLTKDNPQDIAITLSSVISQENKSFTWFIYDGSSDKHQNNILELIDRAENCGISVQYVHKHDKSLYDAMNSSLSYIDTPYVIYINAGDMFFQKKTTHLILESLCSCSENIDVLYGSNVYIDTEKSIYPQYCNDIDNILKCINNGEDLYFQLMVCQQAIIYKTISLKNHPIDTNYPIAADHNHFLELLINGANFKKLNYIISIYFGGGFSWQHAYNCVIDWFRVNLKITNKYRFSDKLTETYINILDNEIKN